MPPSGNGGGHFFVYGRKSPGLVPVLSACAGSRMRRIHVKGLHRAGVLFLFNGPLESLLGLPLNGVLARDVAAEQLLLSLNALHHLLALFGVEAFQKRLVEVPLYTLLNVPFFSVRAGREGLQSERGQPHLKTASLA